MQILCKKVNNMHDIKKIFIDGSAGTTGLRLEKRLCGRKDITVTTLPEAQERDPHLRASMLGEADVAFLCLPDAAAREAVAMLELAQNARTVLIDASTAHRTAPGWAYGFPELGADFAAAIRQSKRIAVPGCHASGFLALARPLIRAGLLSRGALLHCVSITGYTGGGKAMIADYESPARAPGDALHVPKLYALDQNHKHLPEMAAYAPLDAPPVFCPIVGDFPCGMEVAIPLHGLAKRDALDCYREFYAGAATVRVSPDASLLTPAACAGRDCMEIAVEGNDARLLLLARFDNLGKGASGAAVQCMNLAIGAGETEGLVL